MTSRVRCYVPTAWYNWVKSEVDYWCGKREIRLWAKAHLAWKNGVCHRRATFDITLQHKTALSFKTRNRLMNFAMLPKYYIVKISPIYRISAIFAHKIRYARFLNGVLNPRCYFVYDCWTQILCTVSYDAQASDCVKLCAIFRPLVNRPTKPVYDIALAPKFCVASRWLPANKSVFFIMT